jgi:Sec-independent protein translocase protein TatA
MALDPLELGTIAAIILVFFLWGPQKIPELARVVAQARREFDNATKELQKVSTSIQDGTSPFVQPSTPVKTAVVAGTAAAAMPQGSQQGVMSALPQPAVPSASGKTGDQLLIEAARKLGIQTQGKTREQIQLEIIAMAQRPTPAPPAPADSQTPPTKGESAA